MAKIKTLHITNRRNYGNYRFNPRLLFQSVEHSVYCVTSSLRKYPCRIAYILHFILQMYFWQVVYRIYLFLGLQWNQ